MKMKRVQWLFILGSQAIAISLHAASAPAKEDIRIMQKLSQGSVAEAKLGRLVQEKATDSSVKAFGERMVKDHERLQKDAESWARNNGVTLDSKPGPEEENTYKEMVSLADKEFDTRYMEQMLDDHKKDVAEVANFISAHPNSRIDSTLKKVLPVLDDHLRLAENVAGRIGVKPDAGMNHP